MHQDYENEKCECEEVATLKKESPVAEAFSSLAISIEELFSTIEKLEGKIAPCMSPDTPIDVSDEKGKESVKSELVTEIEKRTRQINIAGRRLNHFANRVEL